MLFTGYVLTDLVLSLVKEEVITTMVVEMISVHAATIYYTVWARLLTQ